MRRKVVPVPRAGDLSHTAKILEEYTGATLCLAWATMELVHRLWSSGKGEGQPKKILTHNNNPKLERKESFGRQRKGHGNGLAAGVFGKK